MKLIRFDSFCFGYQKFGLNTPSGGNSLFSLTILPTRSLSLEYGPPPSIYVKDSQNLLLFIAKINFSYFFQL